MLLAVRSFFVVDIRLAAYTRRWILSFNTFD